MTFTVLLFIEGGTVDNALLNSLLISLGSLCTIKTVGTTKLYQLHSNLHTKADYRKGQGRIDVHPQLVLVIGHSSNHILNKHIDFIAKLLPVGMASPDIAFVEKTSMVIVSGSSRDIYKQNLVSSIARLKTRYRLETPWNESPEFDYSSKDDLVAQEKYRGDVSTWWRIKTSIRSSTAKIFGDHKTIGIVVYDGMDERALDLIASCWRHVKGARLVFLSVPVKKGVYIRSSGLDLASESTRSILSKDNFDKCVTRRGINVITGRSLYNFLCEVSGRCNVAAIIIPPGSGESTVDGVFVHKLIARANKNSPSIQFTVIDQSDCSNIISSQLSCIETIMSRDHALYVHYKLK